MIEEEPFRVDYTHTPHQFPPARAINYGEDEYGWWVEVRAGSSLQRYRWVHRGSLGYDSIPGFWYSRKTNSKLAGGALTSEEEDYIKITEAGSGDIHFSDTSNCFTLSW